MKHLFLTLLTAGLLAANAVRGQGAGAPVGWLKVSLDTPLRARWSFYTEVETRQANAQLAGQQLGRLGLRLHVAPCLSLSTGYVLAANESPAGSGPDATEHRLYQEVVLTDVAGPVRASHRLRAEERWLRPMPEAGYVFAPRLRYQLRLVVPLRTGGKLPVGSFYAVAADEIFASLGRREGRSFLEENRLSAGLGYRLSRRTAVELAYLHQTQAAGSANQGLARNAVQVSVAVAVPCRAALVRL